ncbi:MAG: branched-chain amino acid ABC transporter substrate-binding protein [Coriobacteriia bacterium]|nr:branched-chain amino acid ABC transporter substrate-binding protein [Coriobacteriia bacterium]
MNTSTSGNTRFIRRLFLSLALMMALALIMAGCSSSESKKAANTQIVKIGFAGPLTGDNALYGISMRDAALIAIDELNAMPATKKAGYTFELKAEDDAGDPKQAVNVANSLITDTKVVALVGHFNSGCSIPAAAVYEKQDLAMVTVSTNPELTEGGYTVVNRITARDDSQGPFAADLVYKRGLTKVVVIDDSTTYGQGLATEFSKAYKKLGGAIASSEAIQSKDVDFSALVTKIREEDPEAVYYAGAHTEGALIGKQLRNAGLDVPLIGGEMIYTPDYIKFAGSTCEGDIATALGLPIADQPKGPEFLKKFKTRYNKSPEAYDTYSYDSTMIIGQAVLDAHSTKPVDVKKAVRAIKYDGVTGNVSFDSKGDNASQVISAYIVKNGKWQPLK